jgi:hypothetical protein
MSILYFIFAIIMQKNEAPQNGILTIQFISAFFLSQSLANSFAEFGLLYANITASISFFLNNAISAIAFGNIKFMLYPDYAIFSSRTPRGEWKLITERKSGKSMAHSTHTNERIIKNIANWFSKSLSNNQD